MIRVKRLTKAFILNGALTFPQVKEATQLARALAGGKGCGPRIVKLLAGNERARQNLIL